MTTLQLLHDYERWLLRTAMRGPERTPLSNSDRQRLAHLGVDATLDGAEQLLEALALVSLLRRAALPPMPNDTRAVPLPDLPPLTTRPLPAQVLDWLHAGLHQQQHDLLPDLLEAMERKGYILPASLLPSALDLATQDSALRPLILAVLGPRGHWLAAQHPQWNNLLPEVSAPTNWYQATSTTAQAAALLAWRSCAADAARGALMEQWDSLKSTVKLQFLPLLATGLSAADHDFLAHVYHKERSKKVRLAAVRLLLRLPSTALYVAVAQWFEELVQSSAEEIQLRTLTKEQHQFLQQLGFNWTGDDWQAAVLPWIDPAVWLPLSELADEGNPIPLHTQEYLTAALTRFDRPAWAVPLLRSWLRWSLYPASSRVWQSEYGRQVLTNASATTMHTVLANWPATDGASTPLALYQQSRLNRWRHYLPEVPTYRRGDLAKLPLIFPVYWLSQGEQCWSLSLARRLVDSIDAVDMEDDTSAYIYSRLMAMAARRAPPQLLPYLRTSEACPPSVLLAVDRTRRILSLRQQIEDLLSPKNPLAYDE